MPQNGAVPSFLIASVSPYASDNEDEGHYYWMYRHLQQMQEPSQTPLTVAIEGREADHLASLLSPKRPLERSHVGFWKRRHQDGVQICDWLARAENENVTHVQCYDGTLRDLFVIEDVARKFPRVIFLFNFHWAVDWIHIAKSSGLKVNLLREDLLKLFQEAPANLIFSAETEVLADELNTAWGIQISVYPIFSMQPSAKPRPWGERDADVLLIPQRSHELELCAELSMALRSEGLKVSLAATQKLMGVLTPSKWATQPGKIFDQIFLTPLPEPRYQEMLQSHRVVVLPYLKEYFKWGSSGKFNEAIALGAFPMVPDETAIATQSNLNPHIHQFSPEALEDTKGKIISRLAAGFPNDLNAIRYQDFAEWMTGFQPDTSGTIVERTPYLLLRVWLLEIGENALIRLSRFFRQTRDTLYRKAREWIVHLRKITT